MPVAFQPRATASVVAAGIKPPHAASSGNPACAYCCGTAVALAGGGSEPVEIGLVPAGTT